MKYSKIFTGIVCSLAIFACSEKDKGTSSNPEIEKIVEDTANHPSGDSEQDSEPFSYEDPVFAKDTYLESQKVTFKVDTVEIDSIDLMEDTQFSAFPYQEAIENKFVSQRNESAMQSVKYGYGDASDSITQYEIKALAQKDIHLFETNFHPFVNTVYTAWSKHLPLVISPDMIWMMIAQGFAIHVGENSEELRDQLVDFEGKKKINIAVDDWDLTPEGKDWGRLFAHFSDSIAEYTSQELVDVVTADFSTTTVIEKAAFQITLMDAVSDYFEFTYSISCGIPEITLEGTPEDWQELRARAQNLAKYDLELWINALDPILEQFEIAANGGEVSPNFWRDMFLKSSIGCGTPVITGWIIKFFPYKKTYDNQYRYFLTEHVLADSNAAFEFSDFPEGFAKVDVFFDDNGYVTLEEFTAGFVGYRQDLKTFALRPEISWAVLKKNRIPNPYK